VQARRRDEAKPHLEASAELARALKLDYELALTLKALADTGVEPSAGARAQELLDGLGVVVVAEPPLP
jgi:hypothetical protein